MQVNMITIQKPYYLPSARFWQSRRKDSATSIAGCPSSILIHITGSITGAMPLYDQSSSSEATSTSNSGPASIGARTCLAWCGRGSCRSVRTSGSVRRAGSSTTSCCGGSYCNIGTGTRVTISIGAPTPIFVAITGATNSELRAVVLSSTSERLIISQATTHTECMTYCATGINTG